MMTALVRMGVLMLGVWLGLSGTSLAKEVFLQDGSILDCESVWRQRDRVVVKVNRDIVLDFALAEVDLKKTFPRTQHKTAPKKRPHQIRKVSHTALPATAKAPAPPTPAAVKVDAAKPALASAPVIAPVAPQAEAKPAPPPPVTPVPAAMLPANTIPQSQPVAAQPEPAAAASPATDAAARQADLERRTKENVEMMAAAIRDNDPEKVKQAIEAQKKLVEEQKNALQNAPKDATLKPEPPWFKYLLMLLVSCVMIIISLWVVFEKAGQSGVKAVIPFYNYYVLMEISGKPGWWFILLMIPGVNLVIFLLAMLSLAEKFGRNPAFGVGLLFLPMFFFPMLAFGGSKYGAVQQEMNFTFG